MARKKARSEDPILRDVFDNMSPLDYRYWLKDMAQYLSENGFTQHKLHVELSLVRVLQERGMCSKRVVKEVEMACSQVTTAEVYAEEGRIGHDIRALANCVRDKVSATARPYVHLMATSFDIVDTANAVRFGDAVFAVLIPDLKRLVKVLVEITRREADTPQIMRTHLQHAVPGTFGFALAEYVSRLGGCIVELERRAKKLAGKFSGATGSMNASSLFFDDPEQLEKEVLAKCGLKPLDHSTQIVQPEPMTRLLCEVVMTAGVIANLCDDMRRLQSTEIAEVKEVKEKGDVGSSTMPHKVGNPVTFENGKSIWKVVCPRLITVLMDQISDHQRDLTNSMSARTYGELIAYVDVLARRTAHVLRKVEVNREALEKNLAITRGIISEPHYIVLSALGHPNAHEAMRLMTLKVVVNNSDSSNERTTVWKEMQKDRSLRRYIRRLTVKQRAIISDAVSYSGIASKRARDVARRWSRRLRLSQVD